MEMPVILKTILSPAILAAHAMAMVGTAQASEPAGSTGQAQTATTEPHKIRSIIYVNKKFGFRFTLPDSWKGYSVSVGVWEGSDGTTTITGEPIPGYQKGPEIVIGHPLSSEANPRQGIPIMVFTEAQWELIKSDQLVVSAAPFGPGEIGRNAKYVFALPARYNYAFPPGWEEVEGILQGQPLKPIRPR
jgi:hypothetical protein